MELPEGVRAPDDARMYLYWDRTKQRWYVRVERKGPKIAIREKYATREFDDAYDAAVAELGGKPRLRRVTPEVKVEDPRRYLRQEISRHGQLRYYVQLRDKLPRIRIKAEHGTEDFDRRVTRAVETQIELYGDGTQAPDAQRLPRRPRIELPGTEPKLGTLRWYWTYYKQSGNWLGNIKEGKKGLGPNTRHQRTLLMEPILFASGELPFKSLTGQDIRAELNLRTPSNGGNLLSAIRGLVNWMIEEGHLKAHEDPTIGVKSGKSRASKQTGGWVPWTEEDMDKFLNFWRVGTEARLMFEQLRCTHLRRGDVHRLGPKHLRRGMLKITTEKSGFTTLVEMPIHPDLITAINATEIGEEVLTGKRVGGKIIEMDKESWAAKFKKYAILAGVNEAKKNCHGVRKARAEDAAYAGMTEAQMMACFGWTDPKMAAHYIAQANRAILGQSGMAKMFEQDRKANIGRRPPENERVTFLSNKSKFA
jgi:hypothetical protein